jgi:hypothetical protein
MTSFDALPSRARLWIGVLAAPLAWVVAEAVGYVVASRLCESAANLAAGAAMSRARVAHIIVCVLCLFVALIGFGTALSNLRAVRSIRESLNGKTREIVHFGRTSFMSYGGTFVSGLFALGILLFATPGIVVNVCNQAR